MKELKDIVNVYDKAHKSRQTNSFGNSGACRWVFLSQAGARMLVTEDGQLTGAIKLIFGYCDGGPLQTLNCGGFTIRCDKINGCKIFRIGF